MTHAELIEWGRRAVACEGWEWVFHLPQIPGGEGRVPVIIDATTQGHLRLLVEHAHGHPVWVRIAKPKGREGWTAIVEDARGPLAFDAGDHPYQARGKALVRALEYVDKEPK